MYYMWPVLAKISKFSQMYYFYILHEQSFQMMYVFWGNQMKNERATPVWIRCSQQSHF